MASIGDIPIDDVEKYDSGLAMLLSKPPKASRAFQGADYIVRCVPGNAYAVVLFSGACTQVAAEAKGNGVLQTGLDMLSMLGLEDLATRDAQHEYLVWWKEGNTRAIAVVSTAKQGYQVGEVKITLLNPDGTVVPPVPIIPNHHPGFRYYRLSQVSDDLFDSFRNMYLAFELLLSSKHPKGRGKEEDWLRNSLNSSAGDLNLVGVVPSGTPDPVDHVMQVVYFDARLPLFHAKDGRVFYAPMGHDADREAVERALGMLTYMVMQMADTWHNTRRRRGGVYLRTMEAGFGSIMAGAMYSVSPIASFKPDDPLTSPAIQAGFRIPATYSGRVDDRTPPTVSGEAPIGPELEKEPMRAIYLIGPTDPLIADTLEAPVNLSGLGKLRIVFRLFGYNENEPRTVFLR